MVNHRYLCNKQCKLHANGDQLVLENPEFSLYCYLLLVTCFGDCRRSGGPLTQTSFLVLAVQRSIKLGFCALPLALCPRHIIDYIFIFSSPVLKVFKVLDFFSSVGKEFQVETTRLLKKFFLMSVLFLEGIKFMAYAVLLVSLTTFSPTNVNQVEKSTLSIPRRILNTWAISNFFRLTTRVQRFSSPSFSSKIQMKTSIFL